MPELSNCFKSDGLSSYSLPPESSPAFPGKPGLEALEEEEKEEEERTEAMQPCKAVPPAQPWPRPSRYQPGVTGSGKLAESEWQ